MRNGQRLPVEAIEEPIINALLAYWNCCRKELPVPTRGQVDPVDMPRLLPYVALVDVLSESPWFRCRVAGNEVEEHFGRPLKGATLGDLSLDAPEQYSIEQQYKECVAERQPIYCLHKYLSRQNKTLHYHRLALPISNEVGNISHLLLGFRFKPWSDSKTAG